MLKLDRNFYVLSRGEQVAKMVEYHRRLSGVEEGTACEDMVVSGTIPEHVDHNFLSDFLNAVAHRYDWEPPTEQSRPAQTYNIAVRNILKALLSSPFQDVDSNAMHFLNLVESSVQDGKVRRLALVGLRVLTDPELPFYASYSTAIDVADTLAGVVISGPADEVFSEACAATMARLLDQQRVPFSESFAAVAALPQYKGRQVFAAPARHLH